MCQVIPAGEQQRSPGGTVTFEGESHGSGVSFFLVNNEPGEGPDLRRHPYSETWIVRSGRARITADGEDIEAGPGDIAVVGPDAAQVQEHGPRSTRHHLPRVASADPGGARVRFRSRTGQKSPMEA
jgi:mannose-6-phosphate isomerase-like protein (cupin superfamily)